MAGVWATVVLCLMVVFYFVRYAITDWYADKMEQYVNKAHDGWRETIDFAKGLIDRS
ncbi:MAG TPA: hypothetical protein VGN57_19150 [Pirellulaceae bacterium]|nr:hypothetical protein [Pirellulaceae bacterium]